MQITRYDLSIQRIQSVRIHGNAKILSVTPKNWPDDFSIHVMQNINSPAIETFIECFTDEEELPVGMGVDRRFIGTIQVNNQCVHVFERK
jgi:hypothetical protein